MLFKIMGSIIVILSCSFLGFMLAIDCRRRPQQLRELQELLRVFENQISYFSEIITDAFDNVSKVGQSETAAFFKETIEILKNNKNATAADAWEQSLKENIKKTSLNREDEEVLAGFGRLLGASDLEGQIANIKLTIERLKLQEGKAEENRKKNENMYKSLGILGGIAVVLVLF